MESRNPRKRRVLIVDDDPEVRRALLMLLARSFDVIEASEGSKALDIIRTERPSVVILDMSMPNMDGMNVLAAAQSIDARVRIVMLTAQNDVALAKKALDLGAVEFMTKPFDGDALRREIGALSEPPAKKTAGANGRPWRVSPQPGAAEDGAGEP